MKNATLTPAIDLTAFDLELALSGAPLVTRDGRPVKLENIISGASYPLRCTVDGKKYCYTVRGTYWINRPDPMDLFLEACNG